MISVDAAFKFFVCTMLFICAWKYYRGRKYLDLVQDNQPFDMMPSLIWPVLITAAIACLEVVSCLTYLFLANEDGWANVSLTAMWWIYSPAILLSFTLCEAIILAFHAIINHVFPKPPQDQQRAVGESGHSGN